jgi:hypothetical protein
MIRLSEKAEKALKAALVTKGPRKGLLLSSAPKMRTPAYAAWSAMMLNVNPYKVGIYAQIMMDDDQREIAREIESFFMSLSPQRQAALRHGLDKDRQALESLGAW